MHPLGSSLFFRLLQDGNEKALILSGLKTSGSNRRACFKTTFLAKLGAIWAKIHVQRESGTQLSRGTSQWIWSRQRQCPGAAHSTLRPVERRSFTYFDYSPI